MITDRKVTVKQYDFDTKSTEVLAQDLPVNALACSLTADQVGALLSDLVNGAGFGLKSGRDIGKALADEHPAIQARVVYVLGAILEGLADQSDQQLDDRNWAAIHIARRMVDVIKCSQKGGW